jgi:hypothetical protein
MYNIKRPQDKPLPTVITSHDQDSSKAMMSCSFLELFGNAYANMNELRFWALVTTNRVDCTISQKQYYGEVIYRHHKNFQK